MDINKPFREYRISMTEIYLNGEKHKYLYEMHLFEYVRRRNGSVK